MFVLAGVLVASCSASEPPADEAAGVDRRIAFCDRLDRIPSQPARALDEASVLVVFVRSDSSADVAAVQTVLDRDARVASIAFISPQDAHADYLSRPGVVPDGEPSVPISAFSPSFLATLETFGAEDREALVDQLESLAEVRGVTIARERPILASLSSITILDHLLYPWREPPGDVGLTFAAYLEVGLSNVQVWRRWIDELEELADLAPSDVDDGLESLIAYHRALTDTWAAFETGDPAGVELQRRDIAERIGLVGPARAFELQVTSACP